MKRKFFIYAVLVGVITLVCGTGVYSTNNLTGDVDAKLKMVSDIFFDANPPVKNCKDGYLTLIDVIVLALPQSGCPTEFNNKIIKASDLFKQNGLFDSQGMKLLQEAYCVINSGKDFEIPGDIKEAKDAVEYCKKWMNMSRESFKQGKNGDAVKFLLNTAIMIVTPMEATH